MKRFQFSVRTLFVLTTLVAVFCAIGVLLYQPPWHNIVSWKIHGWISNATGLHFHSIKNYTGTARSWDKEGRLHSEYEFVNGLRHGRWVDYDEAGVADWVREYRKDQPWDGLCHIRPWKAWIGEYKDGKPWNGNLSVLDKTTGQYVRHCYDDGEVISEQEYKRRRGIDPKAILASGLHYSPPDQ